MSTYVALPESISLQILASNQANKSIAR